MQELKHFISLNATSAKVFTALCAPGPGRASRSTLCRVQRLRWRMLPLERIRHDRRAETLSGFRAAIKLDRQHCGGLVAWEVLGMAWTQVNEVLRRHRVLIGGTEDYRGFFGIPESAPRPLAIANAGLFTSDADVDRLADAIEEAARSQRP